MIGFKLKTMVVLLAAGLAGVTNRQTNPYLANRGIKFNIPLDARTPTYSEHAGPAAGMSSEQSNVAEMWSMDFWTRFLDEMARHRYNVLSLWSLSPFPSLVRVPEYPKTALADVQGRVYNPTNSTWSTVTLKTLTMDDKIAFWRRVMQYARDRGVDVYVFTWNIFEYGTKDSGYGLTSTSTDAKTKDWVRRATRTLFDTYPLLAGIGVTAGEHMSGLSNAAKDYVNGVATNGLQTPLQTADLMEQYADAGLRSVNGLTAGTNKELRFTLGDINAMAWLGRYYAEKILGATDLALFDRTRKFEEQNSAVRRLETALEHWEHYASVATSQYRPQLLTRIGYVDLNHLTEKAAADITMAKEWKPGTISLAAAKRTPSSAGSEADLTVRVPLWQPQDFTFTS